MYTHTVSAISFQSKWLLVIFCMYVCPIVCVLTDQRIKLSYYYCSTIAWYAKRGNVKMDVLLATPHIIVIVDLEDDFLFGLQIGLCVFSLYSSFLNIFIYFFGGGSFQIAIFILLCNPKSVVVLCQKAAWTFLYYYQQATSTYHQFLQLSA